jgi:RNA polymerase sigma-70 factor (ECF subfamily)
VIDGKAAAVLERFDDIIGTEGLPDEVDQAGSAGPVAGWRYRLAVVQHYRPVYRVAHAILRDSAEAEDVTQETFVRYWQRGAGIERPREWLMKVARNGCLDRLRKSGRYVTGADDAVFERPDNRDPAWDYERRELAAELEQAIARLREPQRSLVVLFDVQGMSVAECAQIVGLNVNQVKVYLHRARRRLRLELEASR